MEVLHLFRTQQTLYLTFFYSIRAGGGGGGGGSDVNGVLESMSKFI